MRAAGIKHRLLLLALLPSTAIALTLFVYFTFGQLQLLSSALQERGVTIARQLGPASEYGVITGNAELLDQLTSTLIHKENITGIAITDLSRQVIYSAGAIDMSRAIPNPKDDATLCGDYDETLLFCSPITKTVLPVSDYALDTNLERRVIGAVYVEVSTAEVKQQRNHVIAKAILITGLLLLMTGYFATRIGRSISQPLVSLTNTVSKVAGGNLELSVKATSKGEIGQLERGIEMMIVSLRYARDEMKANIERATAQLRKALEELENKNVDLEEQRIKAQAASEAKSRFLANMSHEIRTPLSGMVGLLFLLRHTKPNIEQQEYLDNLETAAATLRTLIDDVLDLSRIEAGRLVIHEQEFLLRDHVSAIAVMLAPAAHQKNVEFIVHIERDVPEYVSGDPLRLRQVLINLLGNAVKFTERGHVRLHVHVVNDMWHRMRLLRFDIEDSGIGIARDKLDYIFESFAQEDETTTRHFGGSGLGTTISRELVSLMGGDLTVTSEQGKGSCFSFELPMLTSDEDGESHVVNEHKNVLLLEEHALSAIAEKECLETLGYSVTVVTSEQQVMDALDANKNKYGYILLAENQRNCKWQELAERLQSDVPLPASTVLTALTFFSSECDVSSFTIAMHKPLDGKSLARRWDELDEQCVAKDSDSAWTDQGATSPLRVLLAEDDVINARVMTFFLKQKGIDVIVAGNGREALELLHNRDFDLAFLDMRMPEIDGLMVARQWRSEESRGSRLPLIAVTANVTSEDRNACFEAGMDDFISKPVDPERLAELLQRYARMRLVKAKSV